MPTLLITDGYIHVGDGFKIWDFGDQSHQYDNSAPINMIILMMKNSIIKPSPTTVTNLTKTDLEIPPFRKIAQFMQDNFTKMIQIFQNS